MQTDYKTYWSVLDTPAETIQSSYISLCIAIGAGVLWFLIKKYKKNSGDGDRGILLWSTGAFAIIGFAAYIVLTFFHPDTSRQETIKMLNSIETPRVEGVVANFERTFRYAGRRQNTVTIEKFTVDSVQFAYEDALMGKFNSFGETYNRIIVNGQRVRITYKPGSLYCSHCNTILKIEIAR